MKQILRVDFHCHTSASADSLAKPEQLQKACRKKGIDRLVITDHNTIRGALAAVRYDPELFIVGEEIKTTDGEILAAYVQEEIPKGLTPEETIRRLKDQRAFISVSHPFDRMRYGWSEEGLRDILPYVDALEVFNARCSSRTINDQARKLAEVHNLPGTAGSDAHAAVEIGYCWMEVPYFDNPDSLRTTIQQGRVTGKLSPFWVHFYSMQARFRKASA